MEKIRVINFVPGLGSGGVGALMRDWYKRKDDNVVFDIATIGKGIIYDNLIEQGCKIYDFEPITKVGMIKYIKNAYKIIKEGNYDIVHSHVGMMSFFVFLAAKKAKVKRRILHAHQIKYNQDDGKIINVCITNILKKASTLLATDYLACSKAAGVYVFGKKIANNKSIVINNGIDLSRFQYKNKEDCSSKVIGYIARFDWYKNQEFLVDVLKVLRDSSTEAELLLIGGGDSEKVITKARKYGIEQYIRILPPQNNIEEYYGKIDVFAFPSLYEGLGIVAVEAQACGVPTIISPGVPDEAMVSSLAVREELDAKRWANRIEIILNDCVRKDVHAEILANEYDIDSSARKLMGIYKRGILK